MSASSGPSCAQQRAVLVGLRPVRRNLLDFRELHAQISPTERVLVLHVDVVEDPAVVMVISPVLVQSDQVSASRVSGYDIHSAKFESPSQARSFR